MKLSFSAIMAMLGTAVLVKSTLAEREYAIFGGDLHGDPLSCEHFGYQQITTLEECQAAADFIKLPPFNHVSDGLPHDGCSLVRFTNQRPVARFKGDPTTKPTKQPCDDNLPCICARDMTPVPNPICKPTGEPTLPDSLRVFATKSTYSPATDFSSLEAADAICNQEAADAGLVGTFVAWLSDSTTAAKDRLVPFAGEYKLPDGVSVVANNFDDIVDGSIAHRIDQSAEGQVITKNLHVWTGTLVDGSAASSCLDWTNPEAQGAQGHISSTTHNRYWTYRGRTLCNKPGRLYCFEREPTEQPPSGPLKFQPNQDTYYTFQNPANEYLKGFEMRDLVTLDLESRLVPVASYDFDDDIDNIHAREFHWRFTFAGAFIDDFWAIKSRGSGLGLRVKEIGPGLRLTVPTEVSLSDSDRGVTAFWKAVCSGPNSVQFHLVNSQLNAKQPMFMIYHAGRSDLPTDIDRGPLPVIEDVPAQFTIKEATEFARVTELNPEFTINTLDRGDVANRARESLLLFSEGIVRVGLALVPAYGGVLLQTMGLLDSFGLGFSALRPDEPELIDLLPDILSDLADRILINTQLQIDQALATQTTLKAAQDMSIRRDWFVGEYRFRKFINMEQGNLAELQILFSELRSQLLVAHSDLAAYFNISFDLSQTTFLRIVSSWDVMKLSVTEYFFMLQETVLLEGYTDVQLTCEQVMIANGVADDVQFYKDLLIQSQATIEEFRVDNSCCGQNVLESTLGETVIRSVSILDDFVRHPLDSRYGERASSIITGRYRRELRFDIEHFSHPIEQELDFLDSFHDLTLAMCNEVRDNPIARFHFETETIPDGFFEDRR